VRSPDEPPGHLQTPTDRPPTPSDQPVPSGPSDQELIRQANQGSQKAMESLYMRYQDWVYWGAYRVCGNREDALDVLQEVFAYLFGKFPGFQLRAQLKTFLYPAVRNRSLDLLRKRKPTTPLERGLEIKNGSAAADPASRQGFVDLVARLPEGQQEVILLRFVDGLTLEEISQAMEIPLGTVKSRLHNALSALRGTVSRER